MPFKTFENGYPLPASDLNDYLMKQSVMVFASSANRAVYLTAPIEGMLTWLQDQNKYQYYDGTTWLDLANAVQFIQDKSSNYTIVATDAASMIRSTGSAITITIANVFVPGQSIDFYQAGTGQITFAAGAGVTLQSKSGRVKTALQYSGATVLCVASGVYALVGDLGV